MRLSLELPAPPPAPFTTPARGTLGLLFFTTALAMLPHLFWQPPWLGALTAVVLLWRVVILVRGGRVPGAWIRTALSIALIALIVIQYQTLFGKTAGSAMLVAFAGLKVLETDTARDAMLCNILVTVLVLAGFLFDQSPASAAFGALCLMLVLVNFAALSSAGRLSARPALRICTRMLLHAVPLALAAYVLFPRIEGSLWGIAEERPLATSGLSDTVEPGSITSLSLDDSVAFRVDFDGAAPERDQLYWRVLVLERFDGRRWTADRDHRPLAVRQPRGESDAVHYQVTLEPTGKRILPVLELPVSVSGRHTIGNLATARAAIPVRDRIRYRAESVPARYLETARPGPADPVAGIVDARVAELGREFGAADGGAEAIAGRIMAMFRQQPFHYTLSPPRLDDDPLAGFLFDTRRGYCEHYASAFTALMRAAGVPARVVVGYQGGEQNPNGDYWIVRQADAHAWSEIWVEGHGWRRFDPTAAVAPERVELGMDALRRIESAGGLGGLSAERMRDILRLHWLDARIEDMEMLVDSFTHAWNTWVLGYGPEQQRLLLNELGFTAPDWIWMALALAAAIAAFMLLTYLMLALPGREEETPLKHYRRFKRKLARAGFEMRRDEGPRDLGRRAAGRFHDQSDHILAITDQYLLLRYGRDGSAIGIDRLRRMTRALHLPRAAARKRASARDAPGSLSDS